MQVKKEKSFYSVGVVLFLLVGTPALLSRALVDRIGCDLDALDIVVVGVAISRGLLTKTVKLFYNASALGFADPD